MIAPPAPDLGGSRRPPAASGRAATSDGPFGRVAWLGVALALALVAWSGGGWPHDALDWQPGRFAREPWRAFTAVGVHYGSAHRAANLAGLGLTAVLGFVARLPARYALAWLLAWPSTQAALALSPELLHVGGLSGVLHAGVAVVAAALVATGSRRQRIVGLAIGAGLLLKIVGEQPWGPALRVVPGWDFPVVPRVHATGAMAGAVLAALAAASTAVRRPFRRPSPT